MSIGRQTHCHWAHRPASSFKTSHFSFTSLVTSANLVCTIDQRVRPVFESLCVFTVYINYSLKVSVIVTKSNCYKVSSQSIGAYLLLQTVCYTPPEANQIIYFKSVVHNIAGNITVEQTVYYISGLASILHLTWYIHTYIQIHTEFECW